MQRVNGSTIVLLRYPEESEPYIRHKAREIGLFGRQLLLLPKAPLREHLARTSFCDLFVDNREYNSGVYVCVYVFVCVCVYVCVCLCMHVCMCVYV